MSLQITHAGIFSQGMIQWDSDAVDYLARVAIADGQALENAVALAVNDLFIALKDPAFPTPTLPTHWQAVLAGQFLPLCGARTLAGSLLPLHLSMPTPTNTNFVPGDYSRKSGCKGDGTNKRIPLGIDNTLFPQDDRSGGMCITESQTRNVDRALLGSTNGSGETLLHSNATMVYFRLSSSGASQFYVGEFTGFFGGSRNISASVTARVAGANATLSGVSTTPIAGELTAFSRGPAGVNHSNARVANVFAGLSVDLVRMDSILTAYLSALNAAIP